MRWLWIRAAALAEICWIAVSMRFSRFGKRAEEILKTPIRYSWNWAIFQGLLIIFASYFIQRPPIPGISVVALGLVAVVMTVRAEEEWSRTERLAWLVLAVILMIVEVRAISSDHNEQVRREADATR